MNSECEDKSSDHSNDVDIAIVGAGLVGLPLALGLSAQGWSVVLIEASKPLQSSASEGTIDASSRISIKESALRQRCTAMNVGTQQWLVRNGLWGCLAEDACTIERVNVSHKGYFGATRLQAAEFGLKALGYVVNNQNYVQHLRAACENSAIDLQFNARVVSVEHDEHSVTLNMGNGASQKARLLIAADGINSVVRESTGIATSQVDYEQSAVLGMVELATPHGGIAHERFTQTGPLALLPRPGLFMNFVDCIAPSEQSTIEKMTDYEYLTRLQTRFGYRLGKFKHVGPRFVMPLLRIESEAQTSRRTVLMGNAVRLLHPVGGQGYNLSMRDVDELVKLLDKDVVSDPGADKLLTDFALARRADQKSIVRLTDMLARGFRGHASIPGHLRSTALLGLDMISPLRKQFASKTMGVTGL
jgi:2-octaprenyl-6-methoxyphenol hydroxylase